MASAVTGDPAVSQESSTTTACTMYIPTDTSSPHHDCKHSAVPIAWDPSNPYSLTFLDSSRRTVPDSDGTRSHALPSLEHVTPMQGVGCSDAELAALGTIIDATEDFYREYDQRLIGKLEACQQLSLQYRRALRQCLSELTGGQEDDGDQAMETDKKDDAEDETSMINTELLRATYTVLHISDIFLPLIPSSSSFMLMDSDSWSQPGRVTAEFVRYLRMQHYTPPEVTAPLYSEIMEARQPEGFDHIFWEIVESYVVSGCLTQAWNLLQRHSMYQFALQMRRRREEFGGDENTPESQQDYYVAKRAAETYSAFELIRDIMSRAPLPGGRDLEVDELLSLGYSEEVLDDVEVYSDHLPVQPSDFRHWEYNATMSSTTSALFGIQQQGALEKFQTWQEYIKEARRSIPPGQVPELTRILNIMSGDFSDYTFKHWCEALLADLLYCKPDIRPRDIVKRARKFIRLHNPDSQNDLEPILSIMEGDAIKAILLLSVLGGASGAALPATMNALIYNLFVEANIINMDDKMHQTNYLCEAATSILASISDVSVGASLAVRLLSPFILHDGNRVLLASVCDLLGHYFPKSDADAMNMIALCRPLTEKKSIAALDACTDLALARYRVHVNAMDFTTASQWLIDGIALEVSLERPGACCRTLACLCSEMSTRLLKPKLENDSFLGRDEYLSIKQVSETIKSETRLLEMIPETRVLLLAVPIYESLIQVDEQQVFPSTEIVEAMRWVTNATTGVRSPNVAFRFHQWLLHMAHTILKSEIDRDITSVSSFGKEGLQVLMASLQIYRASLLRKKTNMVDFEKILLKALARAELSTNKQLRHRRSFSVWDAPAYMHIRSVDLDSCSRDTQEAVVRMMLDD